MQVHFKKKEDGHPAIPRPFSLVSSFLESYYSQEMEKKKCMILNIRLGHFYNEALA